MSSNLDAIEFPKRNPSTQFQLSETEEGFAYIKSVKNRTSKFVSHRRRDERIFYNSRISSVDTLELEKKLSDLRRDFDEAFSKENLSSNDNIAFKNAYPDQCLILASKILPTATGSFIFFLSYKIFTEWADSLFFASIYSIIAITMIPLYIISRAIEKKLSQGAES
ncbi:hypothetical protein ABUK73_05800 [Agrobacterium sp. BA1120]|uniref:hypothetical protein n=1 Tax=Agrobacterium sp. BA1120 TaxID=3228927 RepID=UPI00336A784A